jgi:hypothetical protein
MQTRLLAQRLLALFVAGWLLFDFPLLRVAAGAGLWWGLPRMAVALFVAWLLLIVCLAVLMEAGAAEPAAPPEPNDPVAPTEPPGMHGAPAPQPPARGSEDRAAAGHRGPAP